MMRSKIEETTGTRFRNGEKKTILCIVRTFSAYRLCSRRRLCLRCYCLVAHISLLKCGINVRVKYLPLKNTLVIIVIRDKIKKLNRESNSVGFSPSFAYKISCFSRSRCIERLTLHERRFHFSADILSSEREFKRTERH